MYTTSNIVIITGVAFSMFLGPDERLQDCECTVALWSVISEVHLSSQLRTFDSQQVKWEKK